MRRRCFVVGCPRSDWSRTAIWHRLPGDYEVSRVWLQRIGISNTKFKNVVVCGRHFAPDDYVHDPRLLQAMNSPLQPRLKSGTLPTLFVPNGPPQAQGSQNKAAVPPASCSSEVSQRALTCGRNCGTRKTEAGTQTKDWLSVKNVAGTQTAVVEGTVCAKCRSYDRTMTVKHWLRKKVTASTQTLRLDFTLISGTQTVTTHCMVGTQTAATRCTVGLQTP
uniref:THAP-type domain-containing protein n=1 Tax=Amblyomma sculptum TaxID=1581419 RepID=A0A1E1XKU9_AMBSC